jgi:hypothetical protein
MINPRGMASTYLNITQVATNFTIHLYGMASTYLKITQVASNFMIHPRDMANF